MAGSVTRGDFTSLSLTDSVCLRTELTKVIAHRREAESAKIKFFYKKLCGLCASAVNQIKWTEFLNFRHFSSL
jgi:hypothetical protein